MSTVLLARIQFAFTVTFHIIWPIINVGLIMFLIIVEILWLKTRNEVYAKIYHFWSKIFALSFALGVVSGIVMSYQFGSIMGNFSLFASPVIGPLLGTEVLTAFFLEAVFLGVMLFGWGRVPAWFHMLATIMVGIGVHNSVIWIIAVVSWMHTPSGISVVDGHIVVDSFKDVIFSPSFMDRLLHKLLACYMSAALFIMGVSAYYVLKDRFLDFAKRSFKICMISLAIMVPLMAYLGDESGKLLAKYQPMKLAAMEGVWDTARGVPTLLFAIPLPESEKNMFELGIPYGTSFIITHDLNGKIYGLKEWPAESRPPVIPVFYSFRIMVGSWVAMFGTLLIGMSLMAMRRDIFKNKILMLLHILIAPLGVIASIAGWYAAEIGRQPWVIYGIMTTKEAVSTALTPGVVLASLIAFIILDITVLIIYIIYTRGVIMKGPVIPINYDTGAPAVVEKIKVGNVNN